MTGPFSLADTTVGMVRPDLVIIVCFLTLPADSGNDTDRDRAVLTRIRHGGNGSLHP